MERPAQVLDVEELLAQAGWVRGLALRLLGDPALAEDVVQETYLAALERRPDSRPGSGLRDWLAAVVRNLALRRKRREAVRPSIERAAARREAIPGADEAVGRMQLQRLLADAILALEEPSRTAVILRHLHGLSSDEIAKRQGCTPEAARQRVSRGLALLRAELDRRSGGDRSVWSAAIAAVWSSPQLLAPIGAAKPFGPAASTGSTAPIAPAAPVASSAAALAAGVTGGMLVGGKSLSIAAAVVLAATALIWFQRDASAPEAAPAAASAKEAVLAAAPVAATVAPAALAPDDAPPSEVQRAPVDAALASDGGSSGFAGRVVDVAGRPLAGAEVLLLVRWERAADAENTGAAGQPSSASVRGPDGGAGDEVGIAAGSTDAEGRFVLSVPAAHMSLARGRRVDLRAEAAGYIAERVEAVSGTQHAIVLQARPLVSGRLLDPEGRPVGPPAKVQLQIADASGETRDFDAAVDESGHWTSTDLEPGRLVRVWGRAKGYAAAEQPCDLELAPAARERFDLTLTAGVRVRGIVQDAETGQPIPGAEVWAETWSYDADSHEPTTVADQDGRFELAGVAADVVDVNGSPSDYRWLLVTARAEGYAAKPFDFIVVQAAPDGACDVTIELPSAHASLRCRIVWPDASPADRLNVHAVDARHNLHFESTDRDGRFEITGLPAGTLKLIARTINTVPEEQQGLQASIEIRPGRSESVELVLTEHSTGTIEGRVLDAAGRPVADLPIVVGHHLAVENLTIGLGQSDARTDADGRYRFEHLLPGRHQVEARIPAALGLVCRRGSADIDLEPGATATVDFAVAPPIAVSGFVDPGGRDVALLHVHLRSTSIGEGLDDRSPAPDGSFSFDGLYPTSYDLVLVDRASEAELARVRATPQASTGLVLLAPR